MKGLIISGAVLFQLVSAQEPTTNASATNPFNGKSQFPNLSYQALCSAAAKRFSDTSETILAAQARIVANIPNFTWL
jgi:hypothetical protein